jgi:hypothetical protein
VGVGSGISFIISIQKDFGCILTGKQLLGNREGIKQLKNITVSVPKWGIQICGR